MEENSASSGKRKYTKVGCCRVAFVVSLLTNFCSLLVHIDTADCSTVVSYGPTSVICGLKTVSLNDQQWCSLYLLIWFLFQSLVTPPMDCPDKGILNAFFRFSETCCANLNNYDRTVIVEFVQATLDKILFHSNIIDLHELCLIEGKYVWEIQLEVICMNLNSGIMEAVLMGVLSTLLQCKMIFEFVVCLKSNIRIHFGRQNTYMRCGFRFENSREDWQKRATQSQKLPGSCFIWHFQKVSGFLFGFW